MEGQHAGQDGEQVAAGVDTPKVPVGDEAPKRGTKKGRKPSSGSFFTSYVVGQRLLIALLGLDEEDLEKFKAELRSFPVRAGFVSIPEQRLQGASAGETSGLLLCYYGEDYAVQVADGALRAIGCALQADWLRRSLAELDVQDRLLGALSGLAEEELERFKDRFRQEEEGGFGEDLEARLDGAGARELSELLLRFWGGDLAAKATAERLKAIGCQASADKLLDLTGNESEQPSFILERHSSCVEQAEGLLSHSSKMKEDLECEVSRGEAIQGLLNPVMVSGNELICKGSKELIRILERDQEHILFKLLSHFVITTDEYKGLVKRKEDPMLKCLRLLIMIQERGERACCRFLECVEMVHPDSIQLLQQIADNESRAAFSVSGDVRPHSAEERVNPKIGHWERVACNCCPFKDFPQTIKPEVIWDSKTSHEAYRFCPAEAGSFHCCCTDLIFEVRGAATVTYQFESWKKHWNTTDAQNLMIVGPLLGIQADPVEAVAAVHFPHFLCLAGKEKDFSWCYHKGKHLEQEKIAVAVGYQCWQLCVSLVPQRIQSEDSFQVHLANFTEEEMCLEEPDRVEPFHVVLKTPKFSSYGAVFKKSLFKQNINVHAMALLYQALEITTPRFHLYILPNDCSLKKAVEDFEQNYPSWRVPKPYRISKPLLIGSHLVVQSLDTVTVCPEELEFQYLDADTEQQYFELFGHHIQDELVLQVVEKGKNELIWKTVVREEELKSPALHPVQEEC